MKSIRQWLIENSGEIRTVDLARIFGGSTVQIDNRLYSKIRPKIDQIVNIVNDDKELGQESKDEIYRQMIAVMAKELLEMSTKTLSASGVAKGFGGNDDPIAREQV